MTTIFSVLSAGWLVESWLVVRMSVGLWLLVWGLGVRWLVVPSVALLLLLLWLVVPCVALPLVGLSLLLLLVVLVLLWCVVGLSFVAVACQCL